MLSWADTSEMSSSGDVYHRKTNHRLSQMLVTVMIALVFCAGIPILYTLRKKLGPMYEGIFSIYFSTGVLSIF